MLGFILRVVAVGAEPLSLAAGLLIGYLFFKEWKQLALGLLLFVIPGMGGMEASADSHGALYQAAAQFIAICLLTLGSFQAFEYFATRRKRPKPEI